MARDEAEELAREVAQLSAAQLPLIPGLRAAADEAANHRLAGALRGLALALEQGQALDEALAARRGHVPQYVAGLVSAASRTGRVGHVLTEMVEHQRVMRELWRSVISGLAYPACVVGAAFVLLVVIEVLLVGEVRTMFDEFEIKLPQTTAMILWFGEIGVWWVLAALGAAVVAGIVVRFTAGAARWRRIIATIPLLGPLWHWSGVAEGVRLLAALLEENVPLPDALRLTSGAARDASVGQSFRSLADTVDQGRTLSQSLTETHRLPALLIPIVSWGERAAALPEALRNAAEMFHGRVQIRALLLRTILPPLAFVIVGVIVLFMFATVVGSLFELIEAMSWSGQTPKRLDSFGTLNLGSLMLLGGALLWTVFLVYGRRGIASDDALKRILSAAAWTMILVGMSGVIIGLSLSLSLHVLPLSLGFWLTALMIVAMVVCRYRAAEQQTLLWSLAVAAERGIPLAHAVRTFADERADEMGLRALRLADLLDAGAPLPEALQRSRLYLATDELVAVRLGWNRGELGPRLRQAATRIESLEAVLGSVVAKCFYLMVLVGAGSSALIFIMLKIVPIFARMFDEFGLILPAPTVLLIDISNQAIRVWPLIVLLCMLMGIPLIAGALQYMGWLPRNVPLIWRLSKRVDSAVLMRSLAVAVRQQQSLSETLRVLSQLYPTRAICTRLKRAMASIDQGADWCESLRANGLIKSADAAVLRSAQRVGNLAWALDEMADSNLRRLAYRMRAWLNLLFPATLLLFGLCVMLIAAGVMLPLIELIQRLSS
jgi:general secretion pathway protein F